MSFVKTIITKVFIIQFCIIAIFYSCSNHEGSVINQNGHSPTDSVEAVTAVNSKTLYTSGTNGRIAYRVLGSGEPLILCNRFRGTLDDLDPAFLDELAKHYTVVTFDYRGIGLSSLPADRDSLMEINDVEVLTKALGFTKFFLLGWSHGGKVAQVYTSQHTDKVEKLVLLGTGPVGIAKFSPEKIFFERALKPVNDFEDEMILFFEPKYEESRNAAKSSHDRIHQRKVDTSKYVTPEKFAKYFQTVAVYNADKAAMDTLSHSKIPMLVISGEHDIVFPIEDWYQQTRKNPNLQIIMLPKAGHGPHSQYPLLTAHYINDFLS